MCLEPPQPLSRTESRVPSFVVLVTVTRTELVDDVDNVFVALLLFIIGPLKSIILQLNYCLLCVAGRGVCVFEY